MLPAVPVTHDHSPRPAGPPEAHPVELLDEGRVTVSAPLLPLLHLNQLDTFQKVASLAGGEVKRDFPGRRTVRLELKNPTSSDGRPQAVYLKRYDPGYLRPRRRLLRRLGWPSAQDEAGLEWRGLQALAALGVRTATPVALGQERHRGIVTRSFLMTLEIPGAVEGSDHASRLPPSQRRRFLVRVAELAAKVHGAGWVHKDFYISHVLVAPGPKGGSEPELFLIDLQRVIQPALWMERWRLKDLGALAYSALKSRATPRDLLVAYLAYLGKKRLSAPDRIQARRVLRRVAWLKTRTPKHDKDFQQLT